VIRTYRYRLYPTRAQREALDEQLGACCELYNAALEHRRRMWHEHGVSVSYGAQSAELRRLRAAGLVPAEANFWSQQAVLRRLDRAFGAFFRRAAAGEKPGFPRFKSRRRFDTLTWTFKGNAGGVQITDRGQLRLQGVGGVKVKWHRPLPEDATLGEVKVTRSRDARRWHVCFYGDLPDPPAADRGVGPRPAIGIDLGVRHLMSLSTGERRAGPRAGERGRVAVRRAARKVARRRHGSHRRQNAAAALARQREREANRRRDSAHKVSREIAGRFNVIGVEDLRVRNMLRSASGTLPQPGRNVAQKRGLNRRIADQGWGQLVAMLAYKAEEAGGQLIKVNPANTSRTCAHCGTVDDRSRHAERFRCTACQHTDNADVNAAKVILARALAHEQTSRPGRGRQAPTDALAAVA
jgi:putative transposase